MTSARELDVDLVPVTLVHKESEHDIGVQAIQAGVDEEAKGPAVHGLQGQDLRTLPYAFPLAHGQVQRALVNLIENALKFSPAPEPVSVPEYVVPE